MKNKHSFKYLLSGIVLVLAIFLNVQHCHKNRLAMSATLSDVMSISTCQAEDLDDIVGDNPVLRSPRRPDDDMTEEEYEELLRRKRR